MNKSTATAEAHRLGLATYRGDTLGSIMARIATHHATERERIAPMARRIAVLSMFTTRKPYAIRRPYQRALPMAMPRDWTCCAGMVAPTYD